MKPSSLGEYLSELIRFAARGLVLRTDALQILLASIVPALFQTLGLPMPEQAGIAVLAYIAYAVAAFVALRFVTAPFFIWRDQQSKIARLEGDFARPERLQNEKLAEYFAETRARLALALGEIGSTAERHVPSQGGASQGGTHGSVVDTFNLMHQFVDDDVLVGLCRDYVQTALIIIDKKDNHENHRGELVELADIGKKLFPRLRRAST